MIYIKITSDVSYDAIYYTTDGTNPTKDSQKYEGPFPVYNNCEIRAIAVKDEWIDSDPSSLFVAVSSATPEIVKKEGTASDNCYIEIINTADYEGAEGIRFYYTIDGTQPDYLSDSFPLGGSLNVTKNCTVRMISGGEDSAPSVGTVEIEINDLRCQTPVINTYYDSVSNTIRAILTSPTKESDLFYTLDGSVPGNESYPYSGEFSIDHNCLLRAVADSEDLLSSDIAEQEILAVLPTPSLYFDVPSRTVYISNLGSYDLENTIFYYTTSGLEPSTSSDVYNTLEGIKASGGSTVKAKAVLSTGVRSETGSFEVPYIYHTVIFDSDGGTEIEYQSIREGATVTEPEPPTKEGFSFVHWYSESPDTPYDFNAPVLEDLTLKALWEEE